MRAQKRSNELIPDEETALLWHHYQCADIIEKSPICSVYRAVHKNTSKIVTIKSLDLRRYSAASGLSAEAVEKEVEICATLKHPYFIQLRDVISGSSALHMIFEHIEGADICFEIVKRATSGFIYSEAVASHYCRQLAEALAYLHDLRIVHRDVRPHNVLLANKDNNAPLKIRGFGIAHRLNGPHDRCPAGRLGIPGFMSPEMVAGREYGCGHVVSRAFFSASSSAVGRRSAAPSSSSTGGSKPPTFSLDSGIWPRVSAAAKDLVRKLLVANADQRLTAAHTRGSPTGVFPRKHTHPETVEAIRRYNQRRQLKSNIISAVNNAKWNRFPVDSFLSADSMPGGDACDSDVPRAAPNDRAAGADMSGVEQILTSLDQISILMDQSTGKGTPVEEEQLQQAMSNRSLHELLQVRLLGC
ncbi:Protein kinase domain-containing protein [Aphelenchoides fujianensis]|nr:Protein kinase domain-containing protein [Aphelenchoides fujianensis]